MTVRSRLGLFILSKVLFNAVATPDRILALIIDSMFKSGLDSLNINKLFSFVILTFLVSVSGTDII